MDKPYLDIAFVILNYNVFSELCQCVESIINKIDVKNFKIVIVDNGSEIDILNKIYCKYKDNNFINIISLNNNLGFANGNNKGIKYVREIYNAKYICCLNNDTIFLQSDFFKRLNYIYEKNRPALIGPLIYLKDNTVQPLVGYLKSIEEYKKELMELENGYELSKTRRIVNFVKKYRLFKYLYFRIKKMLKDNYLNPYTDKKDIILHGCCIIFTEEFFKKLDGFDSRTFMYGEEEILFLNTIRQNLTTLYSTDLIIKHLEDISTDNTYKSRRMKSMFYSINKIKSLKILIDDLKKYR